jgi:hypothetical protein
MLTYSNTTNYRIEQIEAQTGNSTGAAVTSSLFFGFLNSSPDRSTLYFGNANLSSASLAKYDISTPSIMKVNEATNGEYGRSTVLSHDGTMIMQPAEVPQTQLKIFRTDDFSVKGSLITDRPAESAAFSPDDSIAYVSTWTPQSRQITLFDTTTFQKSVSFFIPDRAYSLMTDAGGDQLFAGFQNPNRTVVYLVPELPSALIAIMLAMGLAVAKLTAAYINAPSR